MCEPRILTLWRPKGPQQPAGGRDPFTSMEACKGATCQISTVCGTKVCMETCVVFGSMWSARPNFVLFHFKPQQIPHVSSRFTCQKNTFEVFLILFSPHGQKAASLWKLLTLTSSHKNAGIFFSTHPPKGGKSQRRLVQNTLQQCNEPQRTDLSGQQNHMHMTTNFDEDRFKSCSSSWTGLENWPGESFFSLGERESTQSVETRRAPSLPQHTCKFLKHLTWNLKF